MLTERWCPSCREWTQTTFDQRCPWCETPTELEPKRRRGGKPTGKWGKLTDDELRTLYEIHVARGISMRELGRMIFERKGFASDKSAATCIGYGWKRLGLRARDRLEATIEASTIHGLARDPEHRKKLRRATGEIRGKRCAGRKTQAPGKGSPCSRWAQADSDFCWNHDPRRKAERDEHLRRMRELLPDDWPNRYHARISKQEEQ